MASPTSARERRRRRGNEPPPLPQSLLPLPVEIMYYTMTFMRPPALQRFARTCRLFHYEYQATLYTLFDLIGMLSFYFPDPYGFRILQMRTGLLIAGSFALQFLGRLYFANSNLDLYISQYAAFVVIDWLLTQGYRLIPSRVPSMGLADFFVMPSMRALAIHSAIYLGTGQVVFKFTNRFGRCIDLIVHATCAFSAVLGFHSTAVMNVISCDWAISLVPWATYEEQLSLMLRPMTPRLRDIRAKYESRGFTVTLNAGDSRSFTDGERWIHDAHLDDLLALARGVALQDAVFRRSAWMLPLPEVPEPAPGTFFFTRDYPLVQYRSHVRRDDTSYWRRVGWRFVTTDEGTTVQYDHMFYGSLEPYCVPDRLRSFTLVRNGLQGAAIDGSR
ncbi:hypothetical protein AURDEDRAFT_175488 [Auricularia subglabra TFB-10046 SS5]|uniref:F-box domain-containing protein n=1 Tax=Auricularia subglabra (strain TFB-10046 / SS5) TaxID=717982 RepID=J0CXI3_AURST|nr:hypothetical protein AURDEDRAFT_175488 [Auricularia subglabra TFB-10046 SS5]